MERDESESHPLLSGLEDAERRALIRRGLAVALAFSGLKLLVHVLTNSNYGYFRDELYFIACSKHLAWGYPDHAPLADLLLWVSRHVLGESLPAIRLLSALAGAGTVLLTGLLCLELGGGPMAVAIACLGTVAAPVYLILDTLYTMNSLEPVFWMSAALLVLRAVVRNRPVLLLWAGVLLGLGLQNKHSTMFFGACLFGGLLLSPQRNLFRSRWLWAGVAAMLLLILPNVIWQIQNGLPMLETMETVKRTQKNVEYAPPAFLGLQILMMLPATVLVWLAGWYWLLRGPVRAGRFLGWTWTLFLPLMMFMKAKDYYLAPIYPFLLAAGGIWWSARPRWTRNAVLGLIILLGVFASPQGLPILPPDKFVAWQKATGFEPPKTERGHAGALPQHFGDMFGWPEMVETVARVYHALPPEERGKAAIFCGNYGEAGAIDFFGPRHGLPKAISGHNGYWVWGPRDATGEVLLLLQTNFKDAQRACASVEVADHVGHPYAMSEENFDILVCRGLKVKLPQLWPRLKHLN